MKMKRGFIFWGVIAMLLGMVDLFQAKACSRVLYVGNDGLVITGRTMDWKSDMETNLFMYPRGVERKAGLKDDAASWVSKYGSVVAASYDVGMSDGMNEKGLVVNLLFLVESEYTYPGDTRQVMGMSYWGQYVLDNFATVDEAVADLEQDRYRIAGGDLPGGVEAKVHMAISDPTGNSAIIEYINGKPVIYKGPQYVVLTNSPIYSDMLAINEYWKEIGGLKMLPGTNRAADRFVRGSFYVGVVPKTDKEMYGVAEVASIMRNLSVPFGISTPDQPNISSTRWRSVSDQKNLKYHFETTLTPNMFWIDLNHLDFSKGAPVRKLKLAEGQIYAGDAADKMVPDKGINFLLVE